MSDDMVTGDNTAREVLLETYIQVQDEQEKLGHLPDSSDNFLSRHSTLLQMTGAIQLGLLTASLTILLDFIVLRMILHLD